MLGQTITPEQGLFPEHLDTITSKDFIMNWNDLDGSVLFNKVFSSPIKISEIDIFDIKIDREGATVTISFDLINEIPDQPPIKWMKGYNRCRCGINCGGVSQIKIEGISPSMQAKININKHDSHVEVSIVGDDINMYLQCMHVQLMGPSVYISN